LASGYPQHTLAFVWCYCNSPILSHPSSINSTMLCCTLLYFCLPVHAVFGISDSLHLTAVWFAYVSYWNSIQLSKSSIISAFIHECKKCLYIHCESKNRATFIFTVTLANVGRFFNSFNVGIRKKWLITRMKNFSP